jgi:hypothetical protein
MNRIKMKLGLMGLAVLLLLALALPTIILAQEEATCNPAASRLAKVMDMTCQELLDLQAEGYGLGEIMKAWRLAGDLEGFGDYGALLEMKQAEGLGWGQFKMAARLAGEDGDPEALLALKQAGVGWGLIKKAQAMDAAGLMTFEQALDRFQAGEGWDEIQADLDLEPGPPPWAGPKDKDKKDVGPPPWANNDKKDDD